MTPAELVRRVQVAVVKSRSNAAESSTLDEAEHLWPLLYGTSDPLALLNVTAHVLAKGDDAVSVHDAYNVLGLAWRTPELFDMAYFLRWQEDPPQALDYLREHADSY